jgi:hypothetical protein
MEAPLDPMARAARLIFLLLALTALACNDHSSVVRPTSGPANEPPSLKDGTVSGTVFDHSTGIPRPAAGIRVRIQRSRVDGPAMETTSDATGHYEFIDVPTGTGVVVAPPLDSDYRAPCPFGTDAYDGVGRRIDVHVVRTSTLRTTGSPGSLPTYVYTVVRGTVFGPSRVVEGASVEVANFGPEALSATFTGRDGTFVICVPPPGTGADQSFELRIRKDGYQPLTHVENPGWTGSVLLWLHLVPQ